MVLMVDSIEHLDFLPEGFKYMPCRYCEIPMLVGVRTVKAPHHLECSVKAMHAAMTQMAQKSGPYYDRWKASMTRASDKWTQGGTPPIDPPGDETPPVLPS